MQINIGKNPTRKNKINLSRLKTSNSLKKLNNNKSNSKIGIIDNKNTLFKEKNAKKNKNNKSINYKLIKYIDSEINMLNYKEALKIDKRNYFQLYLSLIKLKHPIIFAFYTKNDFNSKIIKIILFLFSLSLSYTINALFFNDSTMHNIYLEEGSYDIIYQIPKIVYSTIISSTINNILLFLSLTDKKIIEIKNIKNKEMMEKKKINFF